MAQVTFKERLREGKIAESIIARWLMSRGWAVLPVYEKEIGHGKGPQIFTLNNSFAAPDMFVFRNGEAKFIEAKIKTGFTWHRITNHWTTGIDLKHYQDYLKIQEIAPWPIWLFFLHTDNLGAKDTPEELRGQSPVGLFGNELLILKNCENHRSDKWGTSGMVYWAVDNLKLILPLSELPPARESLPLYEGK